MELCGSAEPHCSLVDCPLRRRNTSPYLHYSSFCVGPGRLLGRGCEMTEKRDQSTGFGYNCEHVAPTLRWIVKQIMGSFSLGTPGWAWHMSNHFMPDSFDFSFGYCQICAVQTKILLIDRMVPSSGYMWSWSKTSSRREETSQHCWA